MRGSGEGTRRRGALALAVVVVGCALVDAWVGGGWFLDGPGPLLGSLAVGYVLGAWTPASVCGVAVGMVAAGLTAANQRHDAAYPLLDDLVFYLLLVGGPALAGASLSRRRSQIAELAELGRRLEDQRAADVEAARLEERQRVEVAVHRRLIEQVGAVVLLAEGALNHPRPATAAEALTTIEDAARAALAELRTAVGTLRTSPEPEPAGAPPAAPAGRRATQPPPGLADAALAGGIGVAMAMEALVRDFSAAPAWVTVVAALAVAAPVAWRRTRPLVALAATGVLATAVTATLIPLPQTVTALALILVTAYAAGAHGPGWLPALALSWAAAGGLVVAQPLPPELDGLLPTLVLVGLAALAGVLAAQAERRQAALGASLAALERGREIEQRSAAAATRLELARGLHDSVAQAMTITCLQAAAARLPGADADAALAVVLEAARDCTAELRAGIDELDGEPRGLDVAALQRLADRSGLWVDWRVDPHADLTGGPGALLQRVLREGLTNAARHAPGSRIVVHVTADGDRIDVEVVDDGSGVTASELGTGTGLVGLRESLARAGGTLEAGARPAGGFRLAASVPRRQGVAA